MSLCLDREIFSFASDRSDIRAIDTFALSMEGSHLQFHYSQLRPCVCIHGYVTKFLPRVQKYFRVDVRVWKSFYRLITAFVVIIWVFFYDLGKMWILLFIEIDVIRFLNDLL